MQIDGQVPYEKRVPWIKKIWQGRFKRGADVSFGGCNFTKFDNKQVSVSLSLLTVKSVGTKHWPFKLFEVKLVTGRITMWHVCILGLMFGVSMKHDVDAKGDLAGPDKKHFYYGFICINHNNKTFEEVVNLNANR
jgi:hypothetical protein